MKTFLQLSSQSHPLLLANVWDVPSTILAEQCGYQAIGTSSAAIANTLGYGDGEQISFDKMLLVVERIALAAKQRNMPLTVDLEAGYSQDTHQVVEYIHCLAESGVKGINLEDSQMLGTRQLKDPYPFSCMVTDISQWIQKQSVDMFLNVRTDAFVIGHEKALDETLMRGSLYEKAGADGIFVPGVVDRHDIQTIAERIKLPLNVMTLPQLPDMNTLAQLGVKRLSMGDCFFNRINQEAKRLFDAIQREQSFRMLFNQ